MSRQLGNTPFTATEKKRIFFHEPKRKYHTCRKPIEKARIDLECFSQFYQGMICKCSIARRNQMEDEQSQHEQQDEIVNPDQINEQEHLEEQKMQSEEEEKKRDEEKNSQILANRSNQNNQYVTRKEFSEFKREIKSNFKKIFDKLDIDYDQ